MTPLVIGTRDSRLARAQTELVVDKLRALHPGLEIRIEHFTTTGDRVTDRPLHAVGVKGLFTKELDEALLDRRIDCAVHSAKDLPSKFPDGVVIAAVPERDSPFDCLVGPRPLVFAKLALGARLGTSSLRRRAQLLARRPDLEIESLRGNLDTRWRRLEEGRFDAAVLALAGATRLGWADRVRDILSAEVSLPAPCQGALAVTARVGDDATLSLLAALDDAGARIEVTAERGFLTALEGGCSVPAAALAQRDGGRLLLRARVASPDGGRLIQEESEGTYADAEAIGREAAERLLARGGREVLAALSGPLAGRRILVTRPRAQADALAAPLRARGAEVVLAPVIRIAEPADAAPLDDALRRLSEYDWLIVTSQNTVARLRDRAAKLGLALDRTRPQIAAIGDATAESLRALGWRADVIAEEFRAEGLVEALAKFPLHGTRILLPRARDARDVLPQELDARGARVDVVVAYETLPDAEGTEIARRALAGKKIDAVTFTASSTVRALVAAIGGSKEAEAALASVVRACIGPITSSTLRDAGYPPSVEASPYTIPALVDALVMHFRGAR